MEGQKRAPLFKRRGDYTMLTKTIPALLSAAADANYGYPDGPSPDISSNVRTREQSGGLFADRRFSASPLTTLREPKPCDNVCRP